MTLIFTLFLVCTVIQLIYWLGAFSPLAFYQRSSLPAVSSSSPEGVSVVICAHNELPNLKLLLPDLIGQDYTKYELIIIDDRSGDGTSGWLRNQQIVTPNLKSITVQDVPGDINPKKYALLKGIERARFDIILLTDADCRPLTSSWISTMAGSYKKNTRIVLGYSGYQHLPGFLNRFIRYETLLTAIQYFSRAIDGKPYMGVGRNLSYSKTFFTENKGLDQYMGITGGDDDLFVNKFAMGENTAVCIDKKAFTRSIPKTCWTGYFSQKKRHLSVGKHYKPADKWLLGIFSATHIIFWSSLVSLLIASTMVHWVAAGFILRQFALSWIVEKSSGKLDERIEIFYLPLLDFLFSLFYLYTGLAALSSRKITWH